MVLSSKIKTLQFTGSGANFSVGQNYAPSEPWPRVTVKNYSASINYDTGSMRVELLREMGEVEFTRRHQAAPRSLAAFEKSDWPDDWRERVRICKQYDGVG